MKKYSFAHLSIIILLLAIFSFAFTSQKVSAREIFSDSKNSLGANIITKSDFQFFKAKMNMYRVDQEGKSFEKPITLDSSLGAGPGDSECTSRNSTLVFDALEVNPQTGQPIGGECVSGGSPSTRFLLSVNGSIVDSTFLVVDDINLLPGFESGHLTSFSLMVHWYPPAPRPLVIGLYFYDSFNPQCSASSFPGGSSYVDGIIFVSEEPLAPGDYIIPIDLGCDSSNWPSLPRDGRGSYELVLGDSYNQNNGAITPATNSTLFRWGTESSRPGSQTLPVFATRNADFDFFDQDECGLATPLPASAASCEITNVSVALSLWAVPFDKCAGIVRGDANCDNTITNFDIDPFVAALVGNLQQYQQGAPAWCYEKKSCWGDVDLSGDFTNFDIDPFVQLLINPQQTGACCITTGEDFSCAVAPNNFCVAGNRSFMGQGSTCNPFPCNSPPPAPVLSACCYTTPCGENGCVRSNCGIVTASNCTLLNGTLLPEVNSCSPFPQECSPPTPVAGACCISGQCNPLTQSSCQQANGFFLGNNSQCSAQSCSFGACTYLSNGSNTCELLSSSECTARNGLYAGNGRQCSQSGACCQQFGTSCLNVNSNASCSFSSQLFIPGGSCSVASCSPYSHWGSCTFPVGAGLTACEAISLHECQNRNGVYGGDNSQCAVTLGACCAIPEDIVGCSQTWYSDCVAQGGTWRGLGTECVDTCPYSQNIPGLTLLKDIVHGSSSSWPVSFTQFGSSVLFSANSSLWRTDGTPQGTQIVKDIYITSLSSAGFLPSQNILLFGADNNTGGVELWRTDGTPAGTYMVKDIAQGSASSFPNNFISMGSYMLFVADDGVHSAELWRTDGTPAGTYMVKDISPGSSSSYISGGVVMNGVLYFGANDGAFGQELWRTDGTDTGTRLVKDIYPGNNINPSFIGGIVLGNKIIFSGQNPTSGIELWVSDGTELGTMLLTDIAPGASSSSPSGFVLYGNNVLFSAGSSATTKLWKTDGTPQGTVMIKDLTSLGVSGYSIYSPVQFNSQIYFAATTTTGQSILKTDGTPAGTISVAQFPNQLFSLSLVPTQNAIYSSAFTSQTGYELWYNDGTSNGNNFVNIMPGSLDSNPSYLMAAGNNLYFSANGPNIGNELWKFSQ